MRPVELECITLDPDPILPLALGGVCKCGGVETHRMISIVTCGEVGIQIPRDRYHAKVHHSASSLAVGVSTV